MENQMVKFKKRSQASVLVVAKQYNAIILIACIAVQNLQLHPSSASKFAVATTNKGMNRIKLQAFVGTGGFVSTCRLVSLSCNSTYYPKR
jgi:hypothetical protein